MEGKLEVLGGLEVAKLSTLELQAMEKRFVIPGEREVFQDMLKKGVAGGKKMLLQAIRDGEEELAIKWIIYGADVCQADGYSNSAMHYCAFWGRLPLVARLLLGRGADVNARNNQQSTPLHLACEARQADMVRLLLACQAEPAPKDTIGFTPLHKAAYAQSSECIALLLRAGAPADAANARGQTPADLLPDDSPLRALFASPAPPAPPPALPPAVEALLALERGNARGDVPAAEYAGRRHALLRQLLSETEAMMAP